MALFRHTIRATAASLWLAALPYVVAADGAGQANEPRGAIHLQPFKQDLMAALKAGLAQGPEQAIAACRLRAPGIAAALSIDGVRMGRTSHKLRNPANSGPEWAREVLEDYLAAESWPAPRSLSLATGREGYAEPIKVQALCLACHGEVLGPDVAKAIAEHYPQDRATGFREGALRGIFWVEYPLD